MKGPFERLKYDLRRVWECPECSNRQRTSGGATSCICVCQKDVPLTHQRVMKLVHDGHKPASSAPIASTTNEHPEPPCSPEV